MNGSTFHLTTADISWKTIKICLDAPFSKLLTLTSSFASLPNLRKLSICVNPVHAPGLPPVPLVPLSQSLLPTPAESPVLKAKSVLPQLLDFDQMHTQTCLATSVIGDPSMPVLREVKRFVRKCPKLNLFGAIYIHVLIRVVWMLIVDYRMVW